MSFLTEVPREQLQSLFNSVAQDKPAINSTIRVLYGKHAGKIGIVKRHMVSRYKDPFRYGNSASHYMCQARGRYGYVVLVETVDGVTFWVDADDKIMVCCEKEWCD